MLNQTHKAVFVTVGTTEFDQLIRELDCEEFYSLLRKHKFTEVVFQIGRGEYEPKPTTTIPTSVIRFSEDISEYFQRSSLIICHCGAGTLLGCLKNKRRIIAVVNNTLSDNHQLELFLELEKGKYILGFRDPKDIWKGGFQQMLDQDLQPYHRPEICVLNALIDD